MKIAFLFLTIDNINFPSLWEKYFKGNYDKINIYCHPKNSEKVTIPWLKNNIIPNLVETGWGYITNAYFNLFVNAIKNKDNLKFISISESCIPLKSFNDLYNMLISEHPKTSYIKFMKVKNYDRKERINTQLGHEKYKFKKHYARFCLSRHHVKILLSKKEDFKFFNKMHVGDEFFLSLLHPYKNVKDFAITFDNWEFVNYQRNKINEEIKKLYDKIEKEDIKFSNLKKFQFKINELKKLKDKISKNPKSYDLVTNDDIKEAQNSRSFFWRKFPKDSNILEYKIL